MRKKFANEKNEVQVIGRNYQTKPCTLSSHSKDGSGTVAVRYYLKIQEIRPDFTRSTNSQSINICIKGYI